MKPRAKYHFITRRLASGISWISASPFAGCHSSEASDPGKNRGSNEVRRSKIHDVATHATHSTGRFRRRAVPGRAAVEGAVPGADGSESGL